MENPFKFGSLVDAPYFTDRVKELDYIVQFLKSENHLVLISPRRFGKSSLVKKAVVQTQRPYLWLNMQAVLSKEDFAAKLLKELLNQFKLEKMKHYLRNFRIIPSINMNPMTDELSVSFQPSTDNGTTAIEDVLNTIQKVSTPQNKQMLSLTRHNENTDALCGKPLPGSFTLHDLNGKLWTEQSLKGHKVVINAWYSGCGPCLREMPILSEWKNKYPNVIFLSVNFEKADKVRKITEARGFNWTHLYGDNYFVKFVGSGGFPLFIVLGEDGLIRYMVNGTNEKIRQDILNVINK